jgi:ketosteroid isomerase-like protein
MSDVISLEDDLRAIAALNDRDVEFALAGDPTAMMSQWADDIVLLQPAGPIVRGRSMAADAFLGAASAIEIIEWMFDFEEIRILGDHAIEWGTYRGRMRPRVGGDAFQTSGKLLRVLQRQPDGSWKIHRTISTVD